jgi:ribosome-associated translation inhibitor RaiA
MTTTPPQVLFTTEGFPVRPELNAFAADKTAKLLRHTHPRVNVVRLHLKRETPHRGAAFFSARASTEQAGPDHVVHATSTEPETAIKSAVDKLERALATSTGARKHQQHHPRAVDLGAALPKAVLVV